MTDGAGSAILDHPGGTAGRPVEGGKHMIKCLLGGLVGGLVGAAVWGAVAYFTGYEIGWIAWGIGVVVGFGVRLCSGGESGAGLGALAAILALASIAGGKYVAGYLTVQSIVKGMQKIEVTDEQAQEYIVAQLVKEYAGEGKALKWPAGKDAESAETIDDYPADVVKDMKSRWAAMTPDEQSVYREQIKASFLAQVNSATAGIAGSGMLESFTLMDALWAFLALGSAFKIGSGAVANSAD